MFVRVLLSALAALALVSGAAGQGCPSSQALETCTSSQMSSAGTAVGSGTATLNLGFTYCAPSVGYGQGTILALQSGTLAINGGTGGSISSYSVTGLTGGISTSAPGSVTIPAGNTITTLGAGQAPIQTFTSAAGIPARITINGETVNLITNSPNVILGGVTLPLSTATLPANLQNFNAVSQDSCTAITGDPLFRGFMGQQFYVGGEDGQVFNMLSTHNMQLNGRFVNLDEGAAMMPVEQEKLRLQSLIAHQSAPSTAAFPRTEPWSHPGNYFGEIGVALMDDNRIHAKAGSYQTGFAKVTLNGRPVPVADEFIVLGQGVNTTFIQRVSAHELMVRTVNVEFTVTNSDNFLNVENIHLEKGAQKQRKFGGMLGHSVSSQWSWAKKDEEAAVVKSNNLFELSTIDA